jgi:hypothetical protein
MAAKQASEMIPNFKSMLDFGRSNDMLKKKEKNPQAWPEKLFLKMHAYTP